LLYVGITRARRYLFLTWSTEGRSVPSPFLRELGVDTAPRRQPTTPVKQPIPDEVDPLVDRLKDWRRRRAQADGVPAYVVFHDRTLVEIARRLPRDRTALSGISGVGPTKLARYADEVLAVLAAV
jgi:superfamily II DNA helicase RecQ